MPASPENPAGSYEEKFQAIIRHEPQEILTDYEKIIAIFEAAQQTLLIRMGDVANDMDDDDAALDAVEVALEELFLSFSNCVKYIHSDEVNIDARVAFITDLLVREQAERLMGFSLLAPHDQREWGNDEIAADIRRRYERYASFDAETADALVTDELAYKFKVDIYPGFARTVNYLQCNADEQNIVEAALEIAEAVELFTAANIHTERVLAETRDPMRVIGEFRNQQQIFLEAFTHLFKEPSNSDHFIVYIEAKYKLSQLFSDYVFFVNRDLAKNRTEGVACIARLLTEEQDKRVEVFEQLVPSSEHQKRKLPEGEIQYAVDCIFNDTEQLDIVDRNAQALRELKRLFDNRLMEELSRFMSLRPAA